MDFFTDPANPAVNPASTQVPQPRPTRLPPMTQPRPLTPFNADADADAASEPRENYKSYSPPGQNNAINTSIAFPREKKSWWPFGKKNITIKNKVPRLVISSTNPRIKKVSNNYKNYNNYHKKTRKYNHYNNSIYVKRQKKSNNNENIRRDVREQNFIREVSIYAGRIMGLRNKKTNEIINFKNIIDVLRDDNIREEDAIYIYNVLFLLIIILFISASSGGVDSQIIYDTILKEYKKRSLSEKTVNVLGEIALASITLAVSAGIGAGAYFATPPVLMFAGIKGIIVLYSLPLIPITLYITFTALKYASTNHYINNKINLKQLLIIILNLILSEKNKIPAKNIKDKLKYWGLKQANVDYLFNDNSIIGKISKLDMQNENDFNEILEIGDKKFVDVFYEFLKNSEANTYAFTSLSELSQKPDNIAPNEPLSSYRPNMELKIVGGYRNTKKVKESKRAKGRSRNSRKLY
jgi:hypothetical protein